MKEYQAVVLRLTRHLRDDEDALTDLLNERSRGGWEVVQMTQDEQRLTLVFASPPEDNIDWADMSPAGSLRFLQRAWRLSGDAIAGGDLVVPCIVENGEYIGSGWGDPPRG